jgi:branched-subunit amino acid permease
MDINIDVVGKLLAPILTAIVVLFIKSYFEARPRLITYLIHATAIPFGDEE